MIDQLYLGGIIWIAIKLQWVHIQFYEKNNLFSIQFEEDENVGYN